MTAVVSNVTLFYEACELIQSVRALLRRQILSMWTC